MSNRTIVEFNDSAMLALALAAVKDGVGRSSFAQCAEWAHDQVTDDQEAVEEEISANED